MPFESPDTVLDSSRVIGIVENDAQPDEEITAMTIIEFRSFFMTELTVSRSDDDIDWVLATASALTMRGKRFD